METGKVKWFNRKKGFGFITKEDGTDAFVSYRNILGQGFRYLKRNQKVNCNKQEEEGRTLATEIHITDKDEDGTVKWFNRRRGFGLIETKDGEELFAHFTNIADEGFKFLRDGQNVTFDAMDAEKGPIAENVSIVKRKD